MRMKKYDVRRTVNGEFFFRAIVSLRRKKKCIPEESILQTLNSCNWKAMHLVYSVGLTRCVYFMLSSQEGTQGEMVDLALQVAASDIRLLLVKLKWRWINDPFRSLSPTGCSVCSLSQYLIYLSLKLCPVSYYLVCIAYRFLPLYRYFYTLM